MVNSFQPQRILVVRTDRIGDVVLTLPMIPIIKSAFPLSSISFLLRSYTQDLAKGQEGLEEVLLYDSDGREKSFFRMLGELRRKRFDVVIVTYPTVRLALLMFLAGIPVRVGTGYRWYSILLNKRVYEHRKTAEKHEAEYNIGLLKAIGIENPVSGKPRLPVTEEGRAEALRRMHSLPLKPHARLVILHPGSGGSARDWKARRFGELAGVLSNRGHNVLITGGPGESELVRNVVDLSGNRAFELREALPLNVLTALLASADVFVSNSTGPLHIAAATGIPVVAFYPPIIQCSSRRWGPLTDKKIIFEPSSIECPVCLGGKCRGDDCMDLISVDEAAKAVESLLSRYDRKNIMMAHA